MFGTAARTGLKAGVLSAGYAFCFGTVARARVHVKPRSAFTGVAASMLITVMGKLPVYSDYRLIEVNKLPPEAQRLVLPHPEGQGDRPPGPFPAACRESEQLARLSGGQALRLRLLVSGRVDQLSRAGQRTCCAAEPRSGAKAMSADWYS